MLLSEKVAEARKYIEERVSVKPDIAMILGSGLGNLAEEVTDSVIIPYSNIPYWPRSTAPGHAGRLIIGRYKGHSVAVMQGRVHYYEGYTMQEVTFPTRVLGELGVRLLIVTNASGAVNTEIKPGSLVAIEDHINYMGINPLIGENNDDWGVRFPDMTHAYDVEMTEALKKVAKSSSIDLRSGVYIAFSGPSFETPAEIRMARTVGADIVGMSTVPEVITANHMGIKVCGISCAANYAAGITNNKLTHTEVLETMNAAADTMQKLISLFIRDIKL